MIAVIDYGRANLGSVEKSFRRVGVPAIVTQDPRAVDEADAVVFPGDGAFHDTMANLAGLGLLEPVRRALDGRRPFLGICIGYQLLFSTQRGVRRRPRARRVPGRRAPVPARPRRAAHGLEPRVARRRPAAVRGDRGRGARFYFVHSYFPVVASGASTGRDVGGLAQEGSGSDTRDSGLGSSRASLSTAWCDYGVRFAAAIETGRIYGTQFHPEKSQKAGIRLLENFAAIVKDSR